MKNCDPNFLDFLDKSGAKFSSGWPIMLCLHHKIEKQIAPATGSKVATHQKGLVHFWLYMNYESKKNLTIFQ
jgi:hypothetical protein